MPKLQHLLPESILKICYILDTKSIHSLYSTYRSVRQVIIHNSSSFPSTNCNFALRIAVIHNKSHDVRNKYDSQLFAWTTLPLGHSSFHSIFNHVQGRRALDAACFFGHLSIVKVFINAWKDSVSKRNDFFHRWINSCLLEGAHSGYLDLCLFLMNLNADFQSNENVLTTDQSFKFRRTWIINISSE